MRLITAFGAAAFLFSVYRLSFVDLDYGFLILSFATIVFSSRLMVKIPKVKGEVTVGDTFVFLALLLYGGEAAIVMATAEAFYSASRFSTKWTTRFFNAGMIAVSTFLTVWVLRLCFGSVAAVTASSYSADFVMMICTMALVQYLANAGIAAIRCAFKTNQTIWYTWSNGFLWTSITYFAGASAAGIIAKLIGSVGVHAVIVAVPIIAIVYFTYRTYLKNVEVSHAQTEAARRHVEELSHHIAEQERITKRLEESEEHFRNAFDHAAGMALVSTEGRWLQVNQSLCDILGYTASELLATNFQEITHPEDLGGDLNHSYQLLGNKVQTTQTEKRYINKAGDEVWVLQSASLVRDEQNLPLHFIFQIQDTTDRKRAEEHIRHAAFHDALTGLPNRTLLADRLSLAVERVRRSRDYAFAVLFIDLDRFKIVNDSLGHKLGDRLLVELSRRLEKCVRPVDTVARLGGDEFAILLDGAEGSANVTHVAERIQNELTAPFDLDGHEFSTSASIGIAYSDAGYDKPEDILRDADTAMYRAKSNGKARHEVFDMAMHTRAVEQLKLESDLRRAAERGEFRVHYQPIVSLTSGAVAGFEALVRWAHPERGMIQPGEFIPLAEETGLIIPIGLTVLREACRQTRLWQESHPSRREITISVNLSSRQFKQADLVEQIGDRLRETGLDPRHLRLEITESVVMENAERAIEMLKRLKSLGVQISIDDFGTGYSSLSYLHRFPIDTLKIDRSFVSRMATDKESAGIVETVVMLASKLGKNTIAEGVETEEQQSQLTLINCDFAQGYFFSKPVDAVAAEALLFDEPAWSANLTLPALQVLTETSDCVN